MHFIKYDWGGYHLNHALPANIRKSVVFFFYEIKRDGITSFYGIHALDKHIISLTLRKIQVFSGRVTHLEQPSSPVIAIQPKIRHRLISPIFLPKLL